RTLSQHRGRALAALVPRLPVDLLVDALSSIRELQWDRGQILVALAPRLTGELLDEALDLARGIDGKAERVEALTELAQRLTHARRDAALREAFSTAERIPFGAGGQDVVVTRIAHLPDGCVPSAFTVA